MFIEDLAAQGQDLGRLVTDLLEHLRHLLLVHHLGEAPASLPVTDETRERLRSQANQLGEATILRLCDLLAVAVEDMRQGGDPRLPLELALIKVTRPGGDLSRESLAYRIEQLEQRARAAPNPQVTSSVPGTSAERSSAQRTGGEGLGEPGGSPSEQPFAGQPFVGQPSGEQPSSEQPSLELAQVKEAWQRSILPAVEQRSIPAASVFREARPAGLSEDVLQLEFPPEADFHRKMAEEPKNSTLLTEALYEVTGRKLAVAFAIGEPLEQDESDEPPGEEDIVELVKQTFDAREIEE
jgi:DNA polymerase III gamma/tau subunit